MTNKKKTQAKKKQAQVAQQAHQPQTNGVKYDHSSLTPNNPNDFFQNSKNSDLASSPGSPAADPVPPISLSSPVPTHNIPTPESEGPSAEEIKERGNVAFKAKKYTEAIDLYTQAIGILYSAPPPLCNC